MRRFGLIGRSLKHSFSQAYFTEKFRNEERTDHVYENYELDTVGAFSALLAAQPDLSGLNVTIPYKKEILPYLDARDEAVDAIGACNCIRIRDGRLEGFNTDWIGFRDSLQPLLGPTHKAALVLGTGGASAAVRYALSRMGIAVSSVSRQPTSGSISYNELNRDLVSGHQLLVNTTPLGTWPDVEEHPPVPFEYLGPDHLLFDLVYNPAETAFLRKGAERGAATKNGYEMLVRQAEAAWAIWNGIMG